jgi:alanine racemase
VEPVGESAIVSTPADQPTPGDVPPGFRADHPARAVVDLTAIHDNIRALRGHAGTAEVMAVVKADGYGHGLLPAARAALAGGATWLGTAQVTEALALRAAGIGVDRARLLTWLYAPGAPLVDLVSADVDVAVAAAWALDEVAAGARAAGVLVKRGAYNYASLAHDAEAVRLAERAAAAGFAAVARDDALAR